ncbi:hypothetical protein C8R44DRAFT_795204 [Mycena epipterygia]|nr:hypothetical protein C8R44DRAFT_795204 [Mycena epipterygia]
MAAYFFALYLPWFLICIFLWLHSSSRVQFPVHGSSILFARSSIGGHPMPMYVVANIIEQFRPAGHDSGRG